MPPATVFCQLEGRDEVKVETAARLLVLDDRGRLRADVGLPLARTGWQLTWGRADREGIEQATQASYDVAIVDLSGGATPSAAELLHALADHDPDLPVLVVADEAMAATVRRTLDVRVARLVARPVSPETLVNVLGRMLQGRTRSRLSPTIDDAKLSADLDRALRRIWIAHQPIVSIADSRVVGYEAFLRCDDPALPDPQSLFEAAERLGRTVELGRAACACAAESLSSLPGDTSLHVNLHPTELLDTDVFSPASALGRAADRVVLEVTNQATLDAVRLVATRVASLRRLGFRVALDSLGAATVGMAGLVDLEPDLVKLDRSLLRGLDTSARRRSVVRALLRLCASDLGLQVACIGVETPGERDALVADGCDVMQGDLFAPPARGFPSPRFRWPPTRALVPGPIVTM